MSENSPDTDAKAVQEIKSMIDDVSRRIGVAATLPSIRSDLLRIVTLLNSWLRAPDSDIEVRDFLIDMKRYILHHQIPIGECVAWNKLKAAYDVDAAFGKCDMCGGITEIGVPCRFEDCNAMALTKGRNAE